MASVRFDERRRVSDNWDRVFRALAAEPRRQVIGSLVDTPADQAVILPESAKSDHISSSLEDLQVELYHSHLPLLAELEFVDWDTDPLVAVRGPKFAEVAAVFQAVHSSISDIPDSLVDGCHRLERERSAETDR